MQLRTLRTAVVSLVAAMSLCACGTTSLPKKGYDKFKNYIASLLDANGYSKKAMKYSSCNYVWITGDGSLQANDLKDTVWYEIYGSLTLNGQTEPIHTYALYSGDRDAVAELDDGTSYSYAYSLVTNKSLNGKTGSL